MFTGRGTTLGIAEEVTFGTPLARTNFLRLVSESMQETFDRPTRPHLGEQGAASANRKDRFTANNNVGGDFTWLLSFDDSTLMLLKHMLGTVVTAGAAPFTHTFTLAETLTIGLTLERVLGNGSAEVFAGSLVDSWMLSNRVGEIAQGRITTIGQSSAGPVVATVPTYNNTATNVIHNQADATPFAFNGTDYDILSWELTSARNLTRRQQLGSNLTSKPVRSDFEEVLLRITREFADDDFLNALRADTQDDAVIQYTGPGNLSMDITLHNALLNSVTKPVSGPGLIIETIEFRGFSDGTDEGLEIVVINDNASALTN